MLSTAWPNRPLPAPVTPPDQEKYPDQSFFMFFKNLSLKANIKQNSEKMKNKLIYLI